MTELAHFMSIGPKLAILSPKNYKNGHISKDHFAEVSFTKKPTPPTFFNKFVWAFKIDVYIDFSNTS